MTKKDKLLSALISAITHNQVKEVAQLLKQGANPNGCEDDLLYSPLHWAAAHSKVEIAKLLIDAGADLEAKDHEGFTPLETACLFNNRSFIRFYHDYCQGHPSSSQSMRGEV
jgi:ankyrin repeat protein